VTTEERLRAALAAFTARVDVRPALHLIESRTAPAEAPAEAADPSN
jgi:hypothetical protein